MTPGDARGCCSSASESTTPVYRDGAVVRLALVEPGDVASRRRPVVPRRRGRRALLRRAGHRSRAPTGRASATSASAADPLELDLLVTAVALTQWHLRHGRCALCGAETDIEQAGWTRRCPVDGSEHFPRTDPAVIMLVHDGGDRCLLGRGAIWPPGRYSTLAGFVEPGESLESAVIREVFEEVGVVVDDVRTWPASPGRSRPR